MPRRTDPWHVPEFARRHQLRRSAGFDEGGTSDAPHLLIAGNGHFAEVLHGADVFDADSGIGHGLVLGLAGAASGRRGVLVGCFAVFGPPFGDGQRCDFFVNVLLAFVEIGDFAASKGVAERGFDGDLRHAVLLAAGAEAPALSA